MTTNPRQSIEMPGILTTFELKSNWGRRATDNTRPEKAFILWKSSLHHLVHTSELEAVGARGPTFSTYGRDGRAEASF